MRPCPKLKERSAEQIAQFLISKYNEKKVKGIIEEMEEWHFTKDSLTKEKNNLFKFLVLVAYDRQPFDRPDYFAVWERGDPESVFSVLEKNNILDLEKVRKLSEQEIDTILRKCIAHKLHLHNTNLSNEEIGTKFAKTFKDIARNINDISESLSNVRSGLDVMRLHQKLCKIHGIKQTIASKFIMYTIRDLRIGNVPFSDLDMISRHLLGEWHNQKWAKRLEDRSLGGCVGLLEEIVEHLKLDPMAIDYFWTLDREYCSKGRCQECDL